MTPLLLAAALLSAAPAAAGRVPTAPELAAAYARVDDSADLRFTKLLPATDAERDLGRRLFFDPRLSADGKTSCATCHDPAKAWGDGLARSPGRDGKALPRNTPSLLDLRDRTLYFWDGRAARLSDQVLLPIQNHREMGSGLADALARVRAVPAYDRAFRAATGGPATAETVAATLTAFLETLATAPDSPFDRGRSDPEALSPAAKRGLVLFAGRGRCLVCHEGPFFTDNRFHALGLTPGEVRDPGRWAVAPTPGSYGAFRTPGLRNAGRTAPYMHDGRFKTLAQVVKFYDRGGDAPGSGPYPLRPLHLTRGDRADLVAFLESLDGTVPAVERPAPFPDGGAAPAPVPTADATPAVPRRAVSDRDEPPPAPARAGASLERACADFSLDSFAAVLAGPDAETPRVQVLRGSVYDLLVKGFVYRALAAGSDAPCAGLAGLKREFSGISQPADFFCRDWYHELSLARAAAAPGPGFDAVCRDAVLWSYRDFDADDAGAVCSAITEDLGSPRALCARLIPRYLDPRQAGACERSFAVLGGEEGPCTRGVNEMPDWLEQRCVEYGLYRRARDRGVSACGSHGLCRALLGDGAGQARALEARLRALACPDRP